MPDESTRAALHYSLAVAKGTDEDVLGESRWPIVAAVAFFLGLTLTLRAFEPRRESVGPSWLVPAIEIALLVTLATADPHGDARHVRLLRRLAILLTILLAGAAIWSTVTLVTDLIRGGKVTNSAGTLLATGGLIWLGNNIVFALIYWEFDSGGARARLLREQPHPDFAFPQHLNPELAPPGWRPRFVDYLYLGLTNGTAFSPTDVMPMVPWAKLTMALQSMVSLLILGLVIARAVNIFT
jgi:uncharacterized membrane protein